MGQDIDRSDADKQCDPIVTNKDIGRTKSVGGQDLVPDDIAIPCGLIAKSFFTDKYVLYDAKPDLPTANKKKIVSDDIAWKSDVEFKFKNQEGDWRSKQWIDIEDQHFIVWMRTAGLPNFRKLYGNVKDGLEAGTYWLRITNSYDVSAFSGSKTFVMSTTNILGGQNYFLAIAYMVVGCLCLILALIFFGVFLSKRNENNQQQKTN